MIELIPFTPDHFDLLITWSSSAEALRQWAGSDLHHPLTAHQLHELLASAEGAKPSGYLYAVRREADRQVIGHGEIGAIDYLRSTGRLMRILVGPPELRGQGYGRQITAALVAQAFGALALTAVNLNVFAFNRPAIQCYQSLGFTLDRPVAEVPHDVDDRWAAYRMTLTRAHWLDAQHRTAA